MTPSPLANLNHWSRIRDACKRISDNANHALGEEAHGLAVHLEKFADELDRRQSYEPGKQEETA